MSFYSIDFIILFCFLLLLIVCLRMFNLKTNIYNNIIKASILFVSYIFIGLIDYRFLLLIVILTVITYYLSRYIRKHTIIYVIALLIPLLTLGYFKYFNFFVSSISKLFNMNYQVLEILLPVGISFYTFTMLGYIIDVKREVIEPSHNILNFAIFVSYFPKLISGPIIKYNDFNLQLIEYKGLNSKNLSCGLQIFFIGMFKKVVIADHLSGFVSVVFNNPTNYSSLTVLLAVVSFTIQLYYDFSGYCDMAIGLSKMIGIELPHNFNIPFISKSISEYWRRWHISLGQWFRDYLFYGLLRSNLLVSISRKLNKKGYKKARKNVPTVLALLIVWLTTGLWHGAGIKFIVYGLIFGVIIIFSTISNKIIKKIKKKTHINDINLFYQVIQVLITFILVVFINILFRAKDMTIAKEILFKIFNNSNGISQAYTWSFFAIVILISSLIIRVVINYKKSNKDFKKINYNYFLLDLSKVQNLVLFFTFIGITILLSYTGETYFIYAKF